MASDTRTYQTILPVDKIHEAKVRLDGIAEKTPLQANFNLSQHFGARILLKREDLQVVRSYKIRGAYNKMASMASEELANGVVSASAGNHAQGVAFACHRLGVRGRIYMPTVTPKQKVQKVKRFGQDQVEVVLVGDNFDDAYARALDDAEANGRVFVHPFNDEKVMEGQGTVGLEILEDCTEPIDYVLVPVGGGGLASGLGSYFKQISPTTKIIGVEPSGAPAMYESLKAGKVVNLEHIDNFVDGAAVRQVGDKTLAIIREVLQEILLVDEGKVCSTILQLYNEEGFVVEPAGALTIAALDQMADKIKGKTVVCIVSGSNNDITRTEEIRERALLHEGLKHYFIVRFPQRAGALRDFLNYVLGPDDDITHFEYTKKHNRDSGPALVGIQVKHTEDYQALVDRMDEHRIDYQPINDNKMLFDMLI